MAVKRIIYDDNEVIAILENDSSVTASADSVIVAELETARMLLMNQAIDVSKINEILGYIPPALINDVFVEIDPLLYDNEVLRTAHFSTMPIVNEDNFLVFNARIKHFRMIEGDKIYIPIEYRDRFKRMRADGEEFSSFVDALNNGTNIFDLMRMTLIMRNAYGVFNFY